MKKFKRYIYVLFIIICLFMVSSFSFAKIPVEKEENIYLLCLWNGKTYDYTFCPQEVKKIYILANEFNIFSVIKTGVYYWPITKEYKANLLEKYELGTGSLEVIKNNKVIKVLKLTKYALKYHDWQLSDKTMELLIGKQAEIEYNKYIKDEEKMSKESDIQEYISEPQEGFIVRLEEGDYKIRFKNSNGEIVSGTEKELRAFSYRRTGLGYNLIQETKWTYPEISAENEDVLYMTGKQVIFLQPYYSAEYPEQAYLKLKYLNRLAIDQSSDVRYIWTFLKRYSKGSLQLLKDNKVIREIIEKPYYVQQTPGYTLGYKIVEWKRKSSWQQTLPSFYGYKLDISINGSYSIRFIDDKGNVIPGSIREIRPIKSQNYLWLYVIAIMPLLLRGTMFFWKRI